MKPDTKPIEVLFALLPDSLALDWAGPAEALRMANQTLLSQGQPARFVLRFVGPLSQTTSSVGLMRSGLEPLPAALQSGHNVTQAAALAGFGSDTQLRRAWHQLGESGTPSKAT